MASKLINLATHEAENQFELSLRKAYDLLVPKLRPPLKLIIPSPSEYLDLNKAVLYGALCETHMAKTYLKHLHAIVSDGYCFFIKLLIQVVDQLFSKMVETAKVELMWVTSVMVDVAGIGFDNLLVSLLRQIVGGDFSDWNLWLSFEMVNLFISKWDLILDEEPIVLLSALYTYLRLLADHYRLPNSPKSVELKQREIEFCVRTIRKQFPLCLKMGRDLIRLLQDLVHIPELRVVWRDLVLNPASFKTPEFSDLSNVYSLRTSSRYFLLRITPEMETQLRFLLTHVKLGSQKRHQAWFAGKFLSCPDRETLICDIVRFICCAHHPSNEIIQSDVIPRWAVIGWLLKCCTKNYVEANVKLALFYDWLFFDEMVDNIMNIEPAILLMVNSIPRYIDITQSLLEFLILLVENYDVERRLVILKGVSSALSVLVRRGVIPSLDVLTSCEAISPFLKEMLQKFLFGMKARNPTDFQPPQYITHSVSSLSLPSPSGLELQTLVGCKNTEWGIKPVETYIHISVDLAASPSPFLMNSESQGDGIGNLVCNLGENRSKSNELDLQLLEKILTSYVNIDSQEEDLGFAPEVLACKLENQLELNGYKLFAPLQYLPNSNDGNDEVQSATATMIRTFIFSQHHKIKDMLLHWLRNARPVGTRLLSYALRLAYEAHMTGYGANYRVWTSYNDMMPLLKIHVDAYLAFISGDGDEIVASESAVKVDKNFILKLVDRAFKSYRSMITHSSGASSKESVIPLGKLLSVDLVSCSEWKKERYNTLFHAIFSHLPDLAAADEDVIRLLVSHLQHSDLVAIQIDIGLTRFSIFGECVQTVLQLVRRSIYWDPIEQHKLWGLIRSELSVTNFSVEKLLLDVFCVADLGSNGGSVAVGGLLMLCCCCAPTPELVGAVMLLPNNKFKDFSAAVLANWVISNSTMLFNSLKEFLEKLQKKNGDVTLDWVGIINQSAFLYLLKYLEEKDGVGISVLEKFSLNISEIKARIGDPAVAIDGG
ncbi:hypothetical protein Nepgr_001843 [Nepenthes gracilis]|uniref:Integrator complex subunit 3 n=1 Tax=Nepenthes gracilis TaxID=150966 RepID=A0AAD3RXC8_NEPGR|nr:hypothetical protein Nepgr_001843 [Nepenthes gracilis]